LFAFNLFILLKLSRMISLLYSIICIILIFVLNQLCEQEFKQLFFYPVLIFQMILTVVLLEEDMYCIRQLRHKLNQSYVLLNDCYGKKKV
jgi:hypothetical protein